MNYLGDSFRVQGRLMRKQIGALCQLFLSVPVVTSDVQEVNICQVKDKTYSITCTYLKDSDARGCVYTLVGRDGVEDMTGTIAREMEDAEQGDAERIMENDICRFQQVTASDWESDDQTGTLIVSGNNFTCPAGS